MTVGMADEKETENHSKQWEGPCAVPNEKPVMTETLPPSLVQRHFRMEMFCLTVFSIKDSFSNVQRFYNVF